MLSVSPELLGVSTSPRGSDGGSLLGSNGSLLEETSSLLTGSGLSSEFSVGHLSGADPVDARVVADSSVVGIDHDDFVEFVRSILSNPVGVEDSHVLASSTDLLFSDVSVGSSFLLLSDTEMHWFTINDTLMDCSLSSSSSDSASVDGVSLLLFESKSSGLVESRWSSNSVHDSELSVLPASNSEDESDNIRLLLSPKLLKVFVCTHFLCIK